MGCWFDICVKQQLLLIVLSFIQGTDRTRFLETSLAIPNVMESSKGQKREVGPFTGRQAVMRMAVSGAISYTPCRDCVG